MLFENLVDCFVMTDWQLLEPNEDGTGTLMSFERSFELYRASGWSFADPDRLARSLEVTAHCEIGELGEEDRESLLMHLHKVPWGARLLHQLQSLKTGSAPPLEHINDSYVDDILREERMDLLDSVLGTDLTIKSTDVVLYALTTGLPARDPVWYQLIGHVQFSFGGACKMLDSDRFCESLPYLSNDMVCASQMFLRDAGNVLVIRSMGYEPTIAQITRGMLEHSPMLLGGRCPGFSDPKSIRELNPCYNAFRRALGDQSVNEELVDAIRLRGLYWCLLGDEADFARVTRDLSPALRVECRRAVLGHYERPLLDLLEHPAHAHERVPVDILALLIITRRYPPKELSRQLHLLSYEDRSFLIRAAAASSSRHRTRAWTLRRVARGAWTRSSQGFCASLGWPSTPSTAPCSRACTARVCGRCMA